MDFKSAFNKVNILIPLLQRDYVQGATEDIIVPFLDSLLTSDCDLNYIYGYRENGEFVPVDGQQRLITLWLLHLYVHSRKENPIEKLNVSLRFQGREYATEFCHRLCEKLPIMLKDVGDNVALDKEIKNQNWFISSWNKNETVTNMLNTLRYLHKLVKKVDIDTIYKRFFEEVSPVSFAFLDMTEENGLDDDIYVKMNGRGRPLSAFENLKSWMDKQVDALSIAKEWKGYMDNRWTNLFWENRNKAQEHPEEIDDEQLHMFCNLQVLFHIKNDGFLLESLAKTKYKEELIEYLELSEDVTSETLYNKILNNLTKGFMLPLVWLERLQMMPPEFFYFSFKAMNVLSERYKTVNESGLYFGGIELDIDSRIKITRIYELSMTDSSFGRTLPILYSIICYRTGAKTNLYDWLRITRNLILNRDAKEGEKYANLKNVMICLETFSEKIYSDNIFDFLSVHSDEKGEKLQNDNVLKILNVFSNQQIQEEILKGRPEMRAFHKEFAKLENIRFFSGRIKALFNMLSADGLNLKSVRSTVNLLAIIFNGGDYGVTGRFDDRNHYFRRLLMTYHPFWYGFERNKYWCFCNGLDEWRRYVRSQEAEALITFIREYAPKELNEDSLYDSIKERVESISKNYLIDISAGSDSSYKYHFIHHPGVWDYMNTKLAIWGNNPFDIVLKKTDSNNSLRMELRTLSLYLDYCHEKVLIDQYKAFNWKIWCWEKNITCFNFQREKKMKDGSNHIVAIDVFFIGVDGKRNSEDCYGLNVFVRTSEEEDAVAINETLLLPDYNNLFNQLGIIQNKNSGRFVNQKNLSRSEIIGVLKVLLSNLLSDATV